MEKLIVTNLLNDKLTIAIKKLPQEDPNLNPFLTQSRRTWMAPSRDYMAPSSSFFFAPGLNKTTALTYLPSRPVVDRLLEHYWRAVHVVARTVHRPSFERRYERFWSEVNSGMEPRTSFQAVVFAALLSATVSMSDERVSTLR